MHDLRRVDINLIGVLEAVLTERNLTHAGERLGLTQPAVSSSVARLRTHFDDPLIIRQGRGFELTPFAQRLLPMVQRAMVEVSRTLGLMPSFDPATTTRTFFISGSDYTLSELIGPLQTLLRRHAPGAKVVFDSLPTAGGVDPTDLLRRDLLIASAGMGIPGRHRSLFLDSYVCVASADHPRLRERDALDLDDLAELRFALNSLHNRYITPVDDQLAAVGIRPLPGVAVRGFLQLPWVIAGTDMIGFMPERVAMRYGAALGLRIVATPLPRPTLIETAYWHPSRDNDPARTWLLEMLLQAAEVVESRELDAA